MLHVLINTVLHILILPKRSENVPGLCSINVLNEQRIFNIEAILKPESHLSMIARMLDVLAIFRCVF